MPATTMPTPFTVVPSDSRGTADFGWLHSRHSFSFGDYHNPKRMGYRSLRVINDDDIAPGAGFGEHPHRDMEIISWMLKGTLRHQDSTGGGGVIAPSDVQVMTAGRGIRHSEYNASNTEPAKLIQIWIQPNQRGLDPRYDQRRFDATTRANAWQLLVSGDTADITAMHIHQDAKLFVTDLSPRASLPATINESRFGYLHVAFGEVELGGRILREGDAAEITGPASLPIRALTQSQLLLFDLA